MICARDVVELEVQLRQATSPEQLAGLLIATADGMEETYLTRTATYNRLYSLMGEIIEKVSAADPPRLLLDLMHHPHPKVFSRASGRYYWSIDADVAEATARAIAAANPESSRLGKEARETVRTYEFNRQWGNTPSAKAAPGEQAPFNPPVEEPAALGDIDRIEFETIAQAFDSEVLTPLLPNLYWPSIRLLRTRLDADDLPTGVSKLGGCPDMPVDLDWPRFQDYPLSFIAQVNLSDILQFQDFTHLPAHGHLLFFYDADLQPWHQEDANQGSNRVLYVKSGTALTRRSSPPDLYDELRFRPASLEFFEDMTQPPFDIGALNEEPADGPIEFDDEQLEEIERFNDFVYDRRGDNNQPKHRMFGFPDPEQDSMFIASEYGQGDTVNDDSWRLLLQVDSDEEETPEGSKGMNWGASGRIYFWARRSDLPLGRFDEATVILQCT